MKYQQKDFTNELQTKIQEMEFALRTYRDILVKENTSIFENRNLEFYVKFDGSNHFQPGYCSTIYIGITDKIDSARELINLHVITIWKCERITFGLPVLKNILRSKIIGELVDESLKEIKKEFKETIEEFLSEEY